jgi:diguanylate cyclase (GGDEF)-like protein
LGWWRRLPALTQTTAAIFVAGAVMIFASAAAPVEGMNPDGALYALGATAVLIASYTLHRGPRLTSTQATVLLALILAVIGLLTWNTEVGEAAVANGATLPMLAVYAVWFLRPVPGRVVLYAGAAWWWVAVAQRGETLLTVLAVSIVGQAVVGAEFVARMRARERYLSYADVLTGAANRRGVVEACEDNLTRLRHRGTPFSVISLDLDGLRETNNVLGHHAGDTLLLRACQHWAARMRPEDLLGRLGGDEFVIVLPGATAMEAMAIKKRLRVDATVAWSAGVAQARGEDTVETLLHRADERMYRQKAERAAARTQPPAPSDDGAEPPSRSGTQGSPAGWGP